MEDFKKTILDFAETNKKTKFYFNDMEKGVKEKIPTPRPGTSRRPPPSW